MNDLRSAVVWMMLLFECWEYGDCLNLSLNEFYIIVYHSNFDYIINIFATIKKIQKVTNPISSTYKVWRNGRTQYTW